MANYVGAAKKLNDQKDAPIVVLLKYKIREVADQIRKMEEELRDCSSLSESESETDASRTTTEDAYGSKSCGELGRTLVQLIRKVNSLKHRETASSPDCRARRKLSSNRPTMN